MVLQHLPGAPSVDKVSLELFSSSFPVDKPAGLLGCRLGL